MKHVRPGSSLYDLEGHDLPQTKRMSMLDVTLRRHRRTPIEQLGTEALRFLLEEEQAADVLLRVAIDRLELDPFLGGDYHPGDLLVAVLTRPAAIFLEHHELRSRAFLVAQDAEELLEFLEPADQVIVGEAIRGCQRAVQAAGGRR
ncbi:MAG: contact-dependent growth inhibition system immunity protein [Gemmatimonadota bacterium]|nr:contact-dependent growth inhibition system immunity protein [Gemmatimonadota bacterium]